jgi:hypothetical protein
MKQAEVHCFDYNVVTAWKKSLQTDLMQNHIIGPFFFAEQTITCNVYVEMLENCVPTDR